MNSHATSGRWVLVCLLATCCSTTASGQVLTWKPGQKDFPIGLQPDAASAAKPDDQPRTILLHPMPEPSPALKYRFWVTSPLREKGNVMPHITRAQLLYLDRPNLNQLRKQYAERSEAWHDGPLAQFPKDEVRKYLAEFQDTLAELHRAANLDRIEQELLPRDALETSTDRVWLPEVQHYRELGRLLSVEIRLALAERRFDDAVRSLEAGFRLSEVVSSGGGSLIVGKLVSIAITGMMLGLVEEMIQQPGAPNLYWALVSLPDSLWSVREAIEGEATNMRRLLEPAGKETEANATSSTWNDRFVRAIQTIGNLGGFSRPTDDRLSKLAAGLFIVATGDRSRSQLVRDGFESSSVSAMPASQAILVATRRNMDSAFSDFFKSALLPSKIAARYAEITEQQFSRRIRDEFTDPTTIVIGLALPAIQATLSASRRIESERNRLATFEALRAYAAAHGNKLPGSLTDLMPVPALDEPHDQKPFDYRRTNETEAEFQRKPRFPGDKETGFRLRLTAP